MWKLILNRGFSYKIKYKAMHSPLTNTGGRMRPTKELVTLVTLICYVYKTMTVY